MAALSGTYTLAGVEMQVLGHLAERMSPLALQPDSRSCCPGKLLMSVVYHEETTFSV